MLCIAAGCASLRVTQERRCHLCSFFLEAKENNFLLSPVFLLGVGGSPMSAVYIV